MPTLSKAANQPTGHSASGSGGSVKVGQEDTETSNKVMIAIDNSPVCEMAFDYYLKKLHKSGNEILFTHSVEHPFLSEGFALSRLQSVSESVEEYHKFVDAKQKEVEKLEKKFSKKLDGLKIPHELKTVDFATRNPGESLVRLADQIKPAMIVMGSRGHGLVSRTLIGSVSEYVLHHARSPVLICHHGKEQLPHHESLDLFISAE